MELDVHWAGVWDWRKDGNCSSVIRQGIGLSLVHDVTMIRIVTAQVLGFGTSTGNCCI